jgi:nucleoside-diphosphate-sugar epimerase
MPQQRKVLITGAAGRIGSFLSRTFTDRYDFVLTDARPFDDAPAPFTEADISDFDAVRRLCDGVDTVVHLAADPSTRATWDSLLPRNVVGVYNVFEAAQQAGCRRVVFASSINAVGGYPQEMQIHTSQPVRPGNLYGATKAWGEAVACYYADQRGLSAICLRFGWVTSRDLPHIPNNHLLSMGLTYEDLGRLVTASIDAPDDVRFGVFQGVSDNRFKRMDITDARAILGYAPEDDVFALAAAKEQQQ